MKYYVVKRYSKRGKLQYVTSCEGIVYARDIARMFKPGVKMHRMRGTGVGDFSVYEFCDLGDGERSFIFEVPE